MLKFGNHNDSIETEQFLITSVFLFDNFEIHEFQILLRNYPLLYCLLGSLLSILSENTSNFSRIQKICKELKFLKVYSQT